MSDAGLSRWAQPSVLLVATDLSDLDRLIPFAFSRRTGERPHDSSSCAGRRGRIAPDPVGMPDSIRPAPSISQSRTLEPWRMKARAQESPCDAVVREGISRTADHRGRPPVQGASPFSWDPEPEQSKQAAPWLCGGTSAALGKPPGHHRGTRGSSRGGRRRPAKGCLARHYVKRDLKPERSTCMPDRREPKSETCSVACIASDSTRCSEIACRRDWTQRRCVSCAFWRRRLARQIPVARRSTLALPMVIPPSKFSRCRQSSALI